MGAPNEPRRWRPKTTSRSPTGQVEEPSGDPSAGVVVARHAAWPLADGVHAAIELVVTDVPVEDDVAGAAATVVQDAEGSVLVVHSVRRGTWDCPGGRREPGEGLLECAVRELSEETGLAVPPGQLRRVGYERIATSDVQDWTARRPFVQVFHARLAGVRPVVAARVDDVDGAQWLTPEQFEEVCKGRFWWPLAAHLLVHRH